MRRKAPRRLQALIQTAPLHLKVEWKALRFVNKHKDRATTETETDYEHGKKLKRTREEVFG